MKNIFESGTEYGVSKLEKRNISLTNYIATILSIAAIVVILARPVFGNFSLAFSIDILPAVPIFFLPVILNRMGLVHVSRIWLCWTPPIFIMLTIILWLVATRDFEASSYAGVRVFLIAFSCCPFLVLNLSDIRWFALALVVPFLTLLFYDAILNLFGVGYYQVGFSDPSYTFNTFRSMTSFLVIGASCFFLKYLAEKSERLNENLIRELAEKNTLLRQQANEEVSQLNEQLLANLQHLSEREFILDQAQRMANVGTWEYRAEEDLLIWSDEMFNIFGLDRTFELTVRNLDQLLGAGQYDLLRSGTGGLLKTGKPFDITLQTTTPLGYQKWIRINGFPVEDNRKIVGGKGLCHDITFFREAQERLMSSEEKFSKAFDLSPDLILIVRERDNIVVETNKKILSVSGYSREDILGQPADEKGFNPFISIRERDLLFARYSQRGNAALEVRLRKKDGTVFQGALSAQRILLSGENHMICVVRDITAEKAFQNQLLLSQANLQATINNTEFLVWSVDRNFRLITFNKPFQNYVKHFYAIDLKVGRRIFENEQDEVAKDRRLRWGQRYLRSLAGEIVTLEETVNGIDFYYSFSPIIENKRIIGVSVFAENVTEVNIRSRELGEANKQIGELKLMALRSVMNPHFVFNVLNSIQYFIARNDRLNAINYLTTFSKLIRSILNHSLSNKIKLSDELEMLQNYIELEMTRFENKFNFVLTVEEDVDTNSIEIPSLLVQPYVENAILHGLYNKKDRGTLKIYVREKGDALYVEIEDDGIGREAAMKLRNENMPKHKSMGIKLTEDRLRLINEQNNIAFEVEDLENDGVPSGTRVRIGIRI